MTDASFELVFRGKLLKDFDRATVTRNLMHLFKLDELRVAAMLDQPKLVLKRGLAREAAQRYQEMLRQAGLMVTMVPMEIGSAGFGAAAGAATPATRAVTPQPAAIGSQLAPGSSAQSAARALPTASAPAAVGLANADPSLLAPVGATLLPERPKVPVRHFDLSKFQLAELGATLVQPRCVARAEIDISQLSLEPVLAAPEAPDPGAMARARLLAE